MAVQRAPSGLPLSGWVGIGLLCVIAGVIGAALSRNFGTSSYTLSYADFISILLTAVTALVTLLGVILAIGAFIGWRSMTASVQNRTQAFLEDGFKEGNPLHDLVISRTRDIMYRGIQEIGAENEADDTEEVDTDVGPGEDK